MTMKVYDGIEDRRININGERVRDGVPVERDKDRDIPGIYLDPLYSDKRFGEPDYKARTIFLARGVELEETPFGGEEAPGLHYVYSDRFPHNDWRAAWEAAKAERESHRNAAFYEAVLQRVLGDTGLELQHIMTGVNQSSLYSYRVFGVKQ